MVSAANGYGGGGYGAYPPRQPGANEKRNMQLEQTVGGATQTYRQAMAATSPQAKQVQQPPKEKGFFEKVKDKFSSIF